MANPDFSPATDFLTLGAGSSASGISAQQAQTLFGNLNLNLKESTLNQLIPIYQGVNGILFDMNDLNTLFQDQEGNTPVTSIGQSVGLVLDKSGNNNHLRLFNCTLGEQFGKKFIQFNGTDSYGLLNNDILNNASSLFANVTVEIEDISNSFFPLYANTSISLASTRFAIGVFNNSPTIQLFNRTLDGGSNNIASLGTIKNNGQYSISANINYANQTISTYFNNQNQTNETGFTDGENIANSDSTEFAFGRGVNRGNYFQGKLFSSMLIKRDLNDFELELVNTILFETLPKKEINVFLVGGQSNTDGRVASSSGDFYLHDNIVNNVQVWNGTNITDYSLTNIGQSGNGSSWVLEQSRNNYSFAHVALKLIAERTSNVVACQVTSGGTPIAAISFTRGSWNADYESIPDGTPRLLEALENRFTALKNYAENLDIKVNVLGMLWHQGEGDNSTTNANNYLTNFTALVNKIREFTNEPNLPIFYGSINQSSTGFNQTIEDSQFSFADSDLNAYCIDNSTRPLLSDDLHFNASGSNSFGLEIANTISSHYKTL